MVSQFLWLLLELLQLSLKLATAHTAVNDWQNEEEANKIVGRREQLLWWQESPELEVNLLYLVFVLLIFFLRLFLCLLLGSGVLSLVD